MTPASQPLRFNGTTWTTLNHTTPSNWAISTAYAVDARARDTADNSNWKCAVAHTSPGCRHFCGRPHSQRVALDPRRGV